MSIQLGKFGFGILGVSLLLILNGCKNSDRQDNNASEVIVLRKSLNVLIMGTSTDYPPFEFKEKGEIVGLDVDIARAIIEYLGYDHLEISDMDFSSLIRELELGHVDFVMAAMTPTPERKEKVDFSDYYYKTQLALVYKSTYAITEVKEMENQEIGVVGGTSTEAYLRKQAKALREIKVTATKSYLQLMQALQRGDVSAILVEEVKAREFVQSNIGIRYSNLPNTEEGYAIAFSKGSSHESEFNSALNALMKKGDIQKIIDKWLALEKSN